MFEDILAMRQVERTTDEIWFSIAKYVGYLTLCGLPSTERSSRKEEWTNFCIAKEKPCILLSDEPRYSVKVTNIGIEYRILRIIRQAIKNEGELVQEDCKNLAIINIGSMSAAMGLALIVAKQISAVHHD